MDVTDGPHILVVDDDRRVRNLLQRYLTDEGFRVSVAEDGETMRRRIAESAVDLVFLDLVLPGDDGLTLARHLRATSDVPIIMLTGKGKMVDRVIGLEMGADDYIAKPFHLREVLARVRTVLRRSAGRSTRPAESVVDAGGGDRLRFEGWELDLGRRELVAPDGRQVSLTTAEFDLLAAFARHATRVLDRDRLMDLARNRDWTPYDRSIDTRVARLRKKIEIDPKNPRLIKTVRGIGYVFTPTVEGK